MKITFEGQSYKIDIRFVKGIRLYTKSGHSNEFECNTHGFRGDKHNLGQHLKLQHRELFSERNRRP